MAYFNLPEGNGFRKLKHGRLLRLKFIQILCCLLLFSWTASSAPAPQRETLVVRTERFAIPCENCHTATGWRPIRAVPEFDHNKRVYPLRGMHEKVQCTQCHVKPSSQMWARIVRIATRYSPAENGHDCARATPFLVGTMPFRQLRITRIASRFGRSRRGAMRRVP